MNIKLLDEHNLEFLRLKEGYTGSSESSSASVQCRAFQRRRTGKSIHVKMAHCWKSHVAAHLSFCKKQ